MPLRIAVVAAMFMVVVAIPVYRHRIAQQRASEIARQDELLLRDVQVELSRSAPEPLEPLNTLMWKHTESRTSR